MHTRTQLGELALQALEQEQRRIQDEIAAIRTELKRMGVRTRVSADGARAPKKRRPMSLAHKRKIGAAMKKRWAVRRRAG
jgi:type VI protein secretion system component VasK